MLSGIGKVTAARLVEKHGTIEQFPPEVLGDQRERALLFKDHYYSATPITDQPLASIVRLAAKRCGEYFS